jgi:hypothetical protein
VQAEVVEKFRKKNFEPQAYTLYSYYAMYVWKKNPEGKITYVEIE